jgi:hypothetical protein
MHYLINYVRGYIIYHKDRELNGILLAAYKRKLGILYLARGNKGMKNKIINSEAIQKLKIVYPELYEELLKLPALKENKDRNISAAEQIAGFGMSDENKPAFELILNEGLKEKRKYCTPLEALLWIAYDRNFSECNPLISDTFTVSSLIKDAWTNTSESGNFSSKRWKHFDEVTDRLNSPQLIAIYTKFNLSYSYTLYEKEGVKSAKKIFKDKGGACYDYALFAGYLLKKGGYDKARGMSVGFNRFVDGFYGGYVGNIYIDPKDDHYYSLDFNPDDVGYAVWGPFTSLEEAAEHVCHIGSQGQAKLKSYKCYDIDSDKGKYVKTSDYFSE